MRLRNTIAGTLLGRLLLLQRALDLKGAAWIVQPFPVHDADLFVAILLAADRHFFRS